MGYTGAAPGNGNACRVYGAAGRRYAALPSIKGKYMTDRQEKRPIRSAQRSAPNTSATGLSKPKSGGAKNKKIANGLVALGSAAIVSLYGLGYARTQTAEALYNADAPSIAIATAAPSATASAQVAAYQSPLYPAATATTSPMTAAAPASSAPVTVAAAPATSAAATATKAPATTTTTTTTSAAIAAYKDGSYTGTGTSRHGSIGASVVVQSGKIVSAEITQCGTRYPCSKIAALPGQVVARQSATVDLVSGATDSSEAYRGAIQNALAKAKATA